MIACAVILAKYGMDGKKDTRTLDSNRLKDHDVKEGDTFDDPRLDKLWNKVNYTWAEERMCFTYSLTGLYGNASTFCKPISCLWCLTLRPKLLESSLMRNCKVFWENSSTTRTRSMSTTSSWILWVEPKVRFSALFWNVWWVTLSVIK